MSFVELKTVHDAGSLIICVGPGLSVAAGLPNADALAHELMAVAPEFGLALDVPQLTRWIERGDAAKVLGLLRRRLGSNFEREVERRLSDRGLPVPPLARAIAELRDTARAVYTTSLDRLLERAFAGRWPSFGEARSDFAQRRRLIFKLFGTLEFAKTWALTSEQLEREYGERSLRRAVFRAAFCAHPIVFVGFGPSDPTLERLLALVPDDDVGPRHFIVLDACTLAERLELERRGLAVIEADATQTLRELRGAAAVDEREPSAGFEGCPYPGLEAFDEARAAVFFGRHVEVSEAAARLGSTTGEARRWLAIEGPSGVGKSSFLRAGVIPALRAGYAVGAPTRWQVATMRPGERPLDNLAHAVCEGLGVLEHDVLETMLRCDPEALTKWLRLYRGAGQGFLLVVDQLEEAVTFAEPEQRGPFGEAVANALMSGELYLATTVRSDFVITLQAKLPSLAGLLNDHAERYALPPISRVGLREAIAEPAVQVGVEIEAELVELIATDAEDVHRRGREAEDGSIRTQQSALPLVAHVLRGLWDAGAADDKLVEVDEYRSLGGVSGALSRSADGILAELDDAQRRRARMLLLRLIKVSRDGADTRQTLPRAVAVQLAGGHEVGERLLARLSGAVARVDGQPAPRLLSVGDDEGVAGRSDPRGAAARVADAASVDRGRSAAAAGRRRARSPGAGVARTGQAAHRAARGARSRRAARGPAARGRRPASGRVSGRAAQVGAKAAAVAARGLGVGRDLVAGVGGGVSKQGGGGPGVGLGGRGCEARRPGVGAGGAGLGEAGRGREAAGHRGQARGREGQERGRGGQERGRGCQGRG